MVIKVAFSLYAFRGCGSNVSFVPRCFCVRAIGSGIYCNIKADMWMCLRNNFDQTFSGGFPSDLARVLNQTW